MVEANGKSITTVVIAIAKGVGDVVAAFVNTGIVKDSMKALSDGLEEFAGYISSGDFKRGIKDFCSDIMALAKWVRSALDYLGILPARAVSNVPDPVGEHDIAGGSGSVDDALEGGSLGRARRTLGFAAVASGGQAGRGGGPAALRSEQQKANATAIADELRKAGAPDEGTASVLGSMQTESSFNPRAHNDVTGGHTGLWQWDARRWPKVRAWIEKQGGDPWDVRWQTRAYIAEGKAQPGDAIYDNGETSGGFQDVMGSKGDIRKAVHGVQRSERFGVGEEGGRAAHAVKWLGNLPGTPAAVPPDPAPAPVADTTPAPTAAARAVTDTEVLAARQRLASGSRDPSDQALVDRYIKEQNTPSPKLDAAHQKLADVMHASEHHDTPVKVEVTDASAAKVGSHVGKALPAWMSKGSDGQPITTVDHRNPKYAPSQASIDVAAHLANARLVQASAHGLLHPLLHGSALTHEQALRRSVHNQIRHGNTATINHSPTYNVAATTAEGGLDAAKRQGERGAGELVRNIAPMLA